METFRRWFFIALVTFAALNDFLMDANALTSGVHLNDWLVLGARWIAAFTIAGLSWVSPLQSQENWLNKERISAFVWFLIGIMMMLFNCYAGQAYLAGNPHAFASPPGIGGPATMVVGALSFHTNDWWALVRADILPVMLVLMTFLKLHKKLSPDEELARLRDDEKRLSIQKMRGDLSKKKWEGRLNNLRQSANGALTGLGIQALTEAPEEVEEPTPEVHIIEDGVERLEPPMWINTTLARDIAKVTIGHLRTLLSSDPGEGEILAHKDGTHWMVNYNSLKERYPSECLAYEKRLKQKEQMQQRRQMRIAERALPTTPLTV